eukprot:scaffold202957_cov30-Prasinocladus_malaysianus.AAC.1
MALTNLLSPSVNECELILITIPANVSLHYTVQFNCRHRRILEPYRRSCLCRLGQHERHAKRLNATRSGMKYKPRSWVTQQKAVCSLACMQVTDVIHATSVMAV